METIIRCSRCILPNSLETIKFDSNGVCNNCIKYEQDFKEYSV